MQMETRGVSTLASATCSNKKYSSKTAVARFLATVCFVFFVMVFASPVAFANGLFVKNLPLWQEKLATKSLTAVLDKMPRSYNSRQELNLLEAVCDKLFQGYKVEIAEEGRKFVFNFEPKVATEWRVKINKPQLNDLVAQWFDEDTKSLAEEIEKLLSSAPLESLSWSESELHEEIYALVEEHLPSWQPTFLITEGDEGLLLEISFAPKMPLVLALEPSVTSTSLPAILSSGIKRELLLKTSALTGLPVAWVKKHSCDIEQFAVTTADEQILVSSLGGTSKAKFSASELAKLNLRVESKRLALAVWAAAYAGTDNKSAELGVHAGGKLPFFFGTELELYTEGIVNMRNWTLDGRFGSRWQVAKDIWFGGEFDTQDDTFWAKVSLAPRVYRFYLWFRYGQYGNYNGAVGYRADDNISFEVEYDSRYDKVWRLKLIGNL